MKLYLNIPSALVDKMLATEENKSLQTMILSSLREKYSHSHIGDKKNESYIQFVLEGKLRKFPMYRSQYELDIWKNHFFIFSEKK